jgi:PAS domain S-box-containing protein
VEGHAAKVLEAAGALDRRVAAADELARSLQARGAQVEEAAEAAQRHAVTAESRSARAEELAAGTERRAAQLEELATVAERHATQAQAAAGTVDRQVQAARNEAASAQAHATAAREAAAPLERRLTRAVEAAAAADGHADRAGEHARAADGHMQALAEAQAGTEQLVARAEAAAVAAEEAMEEARRVAQEHSTDASRESVPAWDSSSNGGGEESRRPLIARRPTETALRQPRAGFDDAPNPKASIRLDGHFGELNPAFSELVGYPEQEFKAASWPPVADRSNLAKHREQLQRMLAGEIESARVDTGYVHAQGLLVPVVGRISLMREAGQPSHFLLEVDAAQASVERHVEPHHQSAGA